MSNITDETLKRGTIELVLLSLLAQDDMYGYQILKNVWMQSKGLYDLKEGTMYPSLYRLTEKGLVSNYKKLVGKKRIRVYYHLTPAGSEYLEVLLRKYNAITEGVKGITDSLSAKVKSAPIQLN